MQTNRQKMEDNKMKVHMFVGDRQDIRPRYLDNFDLEN